MIAYLDLPSGLSGDMLLGCLVDCGWPVEQLRGTIERLRLEEGEWAVRVQELHKGSLRATQVDVLAEEGPHQRRLREVRDMIERSDLPSVVRERAVGVFVRLADAEAKVHGVAPDEIHFHDVGAVDAIIDIVANVAGLHELGVERLYASAVPLGPGWTHSAHGRIPLPAPATLELLAAVAASTRPAPGPGELLTPTGAALLAELATFEQPALTLSRVGCGAGSRDFAWPNIARLWLGEPEPAGPLVQLETNIDDMNPQFYPAIMDKLLAAGAKDVWLAPVQMKKGRPGVVLCVLAGAAEEGTLARIVLTETSTLGVRVHALPRRHEAAREIRQVQTAHGTVRAKVKRIDNAVVGAMPEYEDCLKIANALGLAVRTVHESAAAACQALVADPGQTVSACNGSPGPCKAG